jgi:hypothetical protein
VGSNPTHPIGPKAKQNQITSESGNQEPIKSESAQNLLRIYWFYVTVFSCARPTAPKPARKATEITSAKNRLVFSYSSILFETDATPIGLRPLSVT